MWGKEKISKSISVGLLILVFLFLTFQFILFVVKIVEIRGYSATTKDELHEVPLDPLPRVPSAKKEVKTPKPPLEEKKEKKTPVAPKGDEIAKIVSLEKLPPRPEYKPKPKVELNSADTNALKTLYGIGSYYAKKIVNYRERLGGSFVSPEQLMEVYGIDSARYAGFASMVYVDSALIIPINLWSMGVDSMAKHPYIGRYAAKGIDRYRKSVDSASFSIDEIGEHGILHSAYVQRLKLYAPK